MNYIVWKVWNIVIRDNFNVSQTQENMFEYTTMYRGTSLQTSATGLSVYLHFRPYGFSDFHVEKHCKNVYFLACIT